MRWRRRKTLAVGTAIIIFAVSHMQVQWKWHKTHCLQLELWKRQWELFNDIAHHFLLIFFFYDEWKRQRSLSLSFLLYRPLSFSRSEKKTKVATFVFFTRHKKVDTSVFFSDVEKDKSIELEIFVWHYLHKPLSF